MKTLPMNEDEEPDILIHGAILLHPRYVANGFAPMLFLSIFDDYDCNAITCCRYKDRHYHIPFSCPKGDRPGSIAKKMRDHDTDWIDNFIEATLDGFLRASDSERLFMEVRDEYLAVN